MPLNKEMKKRNQWYKQHCQVTYTALNIPKSIQDWKFKEFLEYFYF